MTLTGFGRFELRRIGAKRIRPIAGARAGQLVDMPARDEGRVQAGFPAQQGRGLSLTPLPASSSRCWRRFRPVEMAYEPSEKLVPDRSM